MIPIPQYGQGFAASCERSSSIIDYSQIAKTINAIVKDPIGSLRKKVKFLFGDIIQSPQDQKTPPN